MQLLVTREVFFVKLWKGKASVEHYLYRLCHFKASRCCVSLFYIIISIKYPSLSTLPRPFTAGASNSNTQRAKICLLQNVLK